MKLNSRFTIVLALVIILLGACAPLTPITPAPTRVVNNTPPPTGTGAQQVEAHLGEPVTLHVGQTALVVDSPNQFGITFYHVQQDSRCPQSVVCVWAGEVRVQITFQENGLLHPPVLELTTTPGDPRHTITVEDYLIQIVDVLPPRLTTQPIAQGEYAVMFRITPAPKAIATPTLSSGAVTAVLDQPFTLKMFSSAVLPDAQLRVTLNGVLDESRCPRQVDCVQAGRALMSFMVERNDRIGYVTLSTQAPDGRTRGYFQGYAVELLDVQPYPETPDQKIPTTDYTATIVVHQVSPPVTAKKNEGFVLKTGQSVQIEGENVEVKFVRVQKDSRCPYPAACAVRGNAVVEATLTQADGTVQTFILNEDNHTVNQRIPDSGFYGLELVALAPYPRADVPTKEIPQDEYEATFVVRRFASGQPTPAPTPTVFQPATCLGLTQQDAEAILGQPVQPLPEANVRMSAKPFDEDSSETEGGICAYLSEEIILAEFQPPGVPVVHSTEIASYAVGAARLTRDQILELLRVANLVRGAKPDGDLTPYLILKTRLAAGDWEGIFETFQQLPNGAEQVHFETVDSFGDEGLWIWRTEELNHYAALLVRDQDSFVLIEAVLSPKMGEAAAKESIHAAMAKIIR